MTREQLLERRSLLLGIKADAEGELASLGDRQRRADILRRDVLNQTLKTIADGYWLSGKDHERDTVHGDQGRAGDLPSRLAAKGADNCPEAMRLGLTALDRDLAALDAPPATEATTDVASMIEAAVAPFREKVEQYEARLKSQDEALAKERQKASLVQLAAQADVLPAACEDFLIRAEKALTGEPRYSPRRPWEPMSLQELTKAIREEAPHLFRHPLAQPAQRKTKDGRLIVPAAEIGGHLLELARGQAVVEGEE